nr:glutathione S-transferase family protein [Enterovirga sp. DB1703]
MKVWGRLSSINVQKVVWCLDEIGLPYERMEAGGEFGLVNTPDYRAMNPNGLVPTIEEDGFVLWESNAIVRYLAAKHPRTGLWPEDLRIRADADRWMDWQATTATPALRDAFWGLIRTPPEKRDEALIRRSVGKTDENMGILDRWLANRPYLAGDVFTAGDVAVGCFVHRWLNMPVERSAMPHVEAWHGRLKARPGARQILSLPVS